MVVSSRQNTVFLCHRRKRTQRILRSLLLPRKLPNVEHIQPTNNCLPKLSIVPNFQLPFAVPTVLPNPYKLLENYKRRKNIY